MDAGFLVSFGRDGKSKFDLKLDGLRLCWDRKKTWDIVASNTFDDYHGSIKRFQTSKLIYQSLYEYWTSCKKSKT